jgi:hypothetical protein
MEKTNKAKGMEERMGKKRLLAYPSYLAVDCFSART